MGRRETACELPAQVRNLPATTRTFTKFSQKFAAFLGYLFNCFYDDDGDIRLYGI